jgi:hypothetical protein
MAVIVIVTPAVTRASRLDEPRMGLQTSFAK